jgi:protoporphyrinogen IX oxidase
MTGWLGAAYLWVKALHVIFVIFWMAGLFVLPRYLVHHSACPPGSPEDAAWAVRERKLRRMILQPASIITWAAGLCLAASYGFAAWLWVKLAFVVLLTGYDHWAVGTSRKLSRGERPYSDRTLRMVNEIPALAIIAIVILVVVKPF